MVETDIDDDYIDEVCNELMIMMAMFVMIKLCVGTVILNDDTYGNDDDDDDDIYIIVECMYVSCHEKVTPRWIVDDDDIYKMVECMYRVMKK